MVQLYYTLGNGHAVREVFAAIAAFTGTGDFMAVIRILLVIAALAATFEIALTQQFKPGGRFFIAILVLSFAVFPKVDVTVIDRVDFQASGNISDVPIGLAVPASYASRIGDWLAEATETIFSVPAPFQFRGRGLLFANRLVSAVNDMHVTDPVFERNLGDFVRNCVYVGLNVGWFSWEDLFESGDMWGLISGATLAQVVFTPYQDPNTGTTNLLSCVDAHANLDAAWPAAISQTAEWHGGRIYHTELNNALGAKLLADAPAAYQYLANVSISGADLVRQATMKNAMKRGFVGLAADANATAAIQDFALAQAEASQRINFATSGAIAGRTLPLLRNVIEVMVLGLFPVMFLVVIIATEQGKVLLLYLKAIVWLHLWPFLYALLHFTISLYSQTASARAAGIPDGLGNLTYTYAMMTESGIAAVNANMASIASVLAWAIPAISWGLVSAGGGAISSLASSVIASSQSSASSAATDASKGNVSLGNTALMNSKAFAQNTAPDVNNAFGKYVDPASGITYQHTSDGGVTARVAMNELGVRPQLTSAIQSSLSTQATSAEQAVSSATASFAKSQTAALQDTLAFATSAREGKGFSIGNSHSEMASLQKSAGDVKSTVSQFASQNNISESLASSLLMAASAGVQVSGMGLSAGARTELRQQGKAEATQLWRAAQQAATESSFAQNAADTISAGQQISADQHASTGDERSSRLVASIGEAQSTQQSLSAARQRSEAFQTALSKLEQSGFSLSTDLAGAFRNFVVGQPKEIPTSHGIGGTWSAADADDNLFAEAARGNPISLQELNRLATAFGENEAARMVGLDGGPSNGVGDLHEAANSGVPKTVSGAAYLGLVEQRSRGAPSSTDVSHQADNVSVDTATRQTAMQGRVSDGAQHQSHTQRQAAEAFSAAEKDVEGKLLRLDDFGSNDQDDGQDWWVDHVY